MNNDLTIYDAIELPTYEVFGFGKALNDLRNHFGKDFIDFGMDDGKTE